MRFYAVVLIFLLAGYQAKADDGNSIKERMCNHLQQMIESLAGTPLADVLQQLYDRKCGDASYSIKDRVCVHMKKVVDYCEANNCPMLDRLKEMYERRCGDDDAIADMVLESYELNRCRFVSNLLSKCEESPRCKRSSFAKHVRDFLEKHCQTDADFSSEYHPSPLRWRCRRARAALVRCEGSERCNGSKFHKRLVDFIATNCTRQNESRTIIDINQETICKMMRESLAELEPGTAVHTALKRLIDANCADVPERAANINKDKLIEKLKELKRKIAERIRKFLANKGLSPEQIRKILQKIKEHLKPSQVAALSLVNDEDTELNLITDILKDQLDKIIEQLQQLVQETAGHIHDVYEQLLEQATQLLSELISNTGKNIITAVKNFIVKAIQAISGGGDFVPSDDFQTTFSALEEIEHEINVQKIREMLKKLKELLGDRLEELLDEHGLTMEQIKKLLDKLLPASDREFFSHFPMDDEDARNVIVTILRQKLNELIDHLQELVQETAGAVHDKYAQLLEQANQLLQGLQSGAKGIVTQVKNFIVNVLRLLHGGDDSILAEAFSQNNPVIIINGQQVTVDQAKEMLENLKKLLGDRLKDLIESHPGLLENKIIKKIIEKLFPEIGGYALDGLSEVEQRNVITDILKDQLNNIIQQLQDALTEVSGAVHDKYAQLLQQAYDLLQALQQGAKDIVTQVKNFIVSVLRILHGGDDSVVEALSAMEQPTIIINGQHVTVEEAKEILKDLKKQLGDRLKELIENHPALNNVEFLKKLLEKLFPNMQHTYSFQKLSEMDPEAQRNIITDILKEQLENLLDQLQQAIQEVSGALHDKYAQLIQHAQQLLQELQSGASGIITAVKNFIVEALRILHGGNDVQQYNILEDVKSDSIITDILIAKLNEIIDQLKELVQETAGHIHDLYEQLLEQATQLLTQLQQGATGIVTAVKNFIVMVLRVLHGGSEMYGVVDALEMLEKAY